MYRKKEKRMVSIAVTHVLSKYRLCITSLEEGASVIEVIAFWRNFGREEYCPFCLVSNIIAREKPRFEFKCYICPLKPSLETTDAWFCMKDPMFKETHENLLSIVNTYRRDVAEVRTSVSTEDLLSILKERYAALLIRLGHNGFVKRG